MWGSILLVILPLKISDLAGNLNLSSDVANNLPLAVYGGVLVIAMLAFPRGIQGALVSLVRLGRRAVRAAGPRRQVSGTS